MWLKIKAYAPKRKGFEIDRLSIGTPVAALHGITRATVMDLANTMGFEVIEKILTLQEVYTADEVFLTGSGAEVVPVKEIYDRNIGTKVLGPITSKLMEAYKKYARTECVTPIYK